MVPLPNLQMLSLSGMQVDVSPSVLAMRRVPLLTNVTSLCLGACHFCSCRAILELVWACPNLDQFLLSMNTADYSLAPEDAARLDTVQKQLRGCQRLRWLTIGIPMISSAYMFGATVLFLSISVSNLEDRGNLIAFLPGAFPRLEKITIYMKDIPDDPVYHAPSLLHVIATALPLRPALSEVAFVVHGFSGMPEAASPHCLRNCKWIVGRAGEWDERPLRALLIGLQKLDIGLRTLTERADGEPSAGYVLSVLPDVHDVLRVLVGMGPKIVYPLGNDPFHTARAGDTGAL
ncbi:hypothetical protein C8Q79DRAFT_332508 [Trametes meyenii]|nr:hypothetical protein C8Q79DRAFT_332508 [Trametes meyenii]